MWDFGATDPDNSPLYKGTDPKLVLPTLQRQLRYVSLMRKLILHSI